MTIFFKQFIRQFCPHKFLTFITITNGNAPTAYPFQMAATHTDILITCHTRFFFLIRLQTGKIDPTVIHMLIIYIAFYIVNIQIIQMYFMQRSTVLCNSCHTGTVHLVWSRICFSKYAPFIANLQILHRQILAII